MFQEKYLGSHFIIYDKFLHRFLCCGLMGFTRGNEVQTIITTLGQLFS